MEMDEDVCGPTVRHHVVGRAFVPVKGFNQSNSVAVPNNLWTKLEDLRHTWCTQPPIRPSTIAQTSADYTIIFQCGEINNPIYYVTPSDLPSPLSDLINIVPSTSEQLLVP